MKVIEIRTRILAKPKITVELDEEDCEVLDSAVLTLDDSVKLGCNFVSAYKTFANELKAKEGEKK